VISGRDLLAMFISEDESSDIDRRAGFGVQVKI
jgi:hypothetical protein